jgi:predicted flap endonuclease-1-like 5' DNA nuclease
MARIDEVEGIGPAYAAKLATADVATTDALLEHGKDPAGRQALAAASGIGETLILEWVNHCDLMRVKGVGSEYADLLEAAGVDSVPELAQRNAASLAAKMAELNAEKALVRQLPSETTVAGWVADAKTLPKLVTH